MRYVSSVFLALLVACGGSTGTQPPPVEPPGIARVVLLTDKGVVFTGKALPGQKLVAQVIDSAGAVIPSTDTSVVLTAQASPGWTVHGDTVIAPATEGFGTVHITATRADPSSAISPDVVVAATFNLTALKLTGTSIMCRVDVAAYLAEAGGNWLRYAGPITPLGFPLDSLWEEGIVVDSVNYAGSGDWRLDANKLFGLIYWRAATLTYYPAPEPPYTASPPEKQLWSSYSPTPASTALVKQVPDSFTIQGTGSSPDVSAGRHGAIPSYTFNAAPFCRTNTAASTAHPGPADDITLTAN